MPPLGLLSVGGPLIDAGHEVRLIDAEIGPLSTEQIVSAAHDSAPEAILIGHSGSTSAHPVITKIAGALRAAIPGARIVYGGVFPTYHAAEILLAHPQIDVIVRGEGEVTSVLLLSALESGDPLGDVPGIAYRKGRLPCLTPPAKVIRNLDEYRVGWELIEDWDEYAYWGVSRAAVIQFSRGCPHRCSYCGQRGFWTVWRHRDPTRIAAEIGWLHRTHGVGFVDLADENPAYSRPLWMSFLKSLAAQNLPVQLVATMRTGDIVRDADILHLYKKAGISRILMGVETTNPDTLAAIRKGTTTTTDREAIQLLRRHDILSQVAYVVGFRQETDRDYFRDMRQLLSYDPDQINAMYATPHRWTAFCRQNAGRQVIELDQACWDYRHQVLATGIPRWRVFLWMKATEAVLQLRPRALWRALAHRDPAIRKVLRWCYGVGRRAWLHEVRSFFTRRDTSNGTIRLDKWWAPSPAGQEQAHTRHGQDAGGDKQPALRVQ